VDSTFANLESLAIDLAQTKTHVPAFMLKWVLLFVKDLIRDTVKRDIFEKNPEDCVK